VFNKNFITPANKFLKNFLKKILMQSKITTALQHKLFNSENATHIFIHGSGMAISCREQ